MVKQKLFRLGRHPVAKRVRLTVLGRTFWLTKKRAR